MEEPCLTHGRQTQHGIPKLVVVGSGSSAGDHLLLPKARIGIVHGQLKEKELVRVMNDFQKGEYDVLLATTIIENGLDLPNVNTLIVEDATCLGLSQAYQLRGRIGRARQQSFAYFLHGSKPLRIACFLVICSAR